MFLCSTAHSAKRILSIIVASVCVSVYLSHSAILSNGAS